MKIIKSILIIILIYQASHLAAQGIQFRKGTWAEIQTQAKTENKHIFLDAYTTWCRPCKYLDKKVFPQKEVGDFINKHFVSYKLDMEKGEGIAFSKKYKVNAFPTLLYFDSKGELVHKKTGAGDAKAIIGSAKQALDPTTQLVTLQKKFEQGNRKPEFLKQYTKALGSAYEYDQMSKVADAYMRVLPFENWTKAKHWKFMSKYQLRSDLESFQYIIKNQTQFDKVLGRGVVTKYVYKVLAKMEMRTICTGKDEARLASFKQTLRSYYGKAGEKYVAEANWKFNFTKFNWKSPENIKKQEVQFLALTKRYMQLTDEHRSLRGVAQMFVKMYHEPNKLKLALGWAEKSIGIKKTVKNTYAKAMILYKLNDIKAALEAAQESLKIAKETKFNVKRVEKLIKKINQKSK